MKKVARYGVFLLVLLTIVGSFVFLPINRWLFDFVEWIRKAGALGVLLYASAYVAFTVLLLPGAILTAAAGFAYGPLFGFLLVSPISVLSAVLAYWLGRSIARDWVTRKVAGDRRFAAIDRAIAEQGFKIVLLLRLSPVIPFNLLNYALGLTRVRLVDYVLASALGMLPGTFLYVYLGSLVRSTSELLAGEWKARGSWQQILYFGGLVATIAATVVLTRVSRQALHDALQQERQSRTPQSDNHAT